MNDQPFRFSHEKFHVYGIAREALVLVVRHRDAFKGLPGELASQLHFAAQSVALNIAEGTGRRTPADQKRHYTIALGSCNELAAALDIATIYGVDPQIADAIVSRMRRVAPMLLKLVRG